MFFKWKIVIVESWVTMATSADLYDIWILLSVMGHSYDIWFYIFSTLWTDKISRNIFCVPFNATTSARYSNVKVCVHKTSSNKIYNGFACHRSWVRASEVRVHFLHGFSQNLFKCHCGTKFRSDQNQNIKTGSYGFQCTVPHLWIAQPISPFSLYCDRVGYHVVKFSFSNFHI